MVPPPALLGLGRSLNLMHPFLPSLTKQESKHTLILSLLLPSRAAGHTHIVQLLESFAVNGLPLPSRPCTPPTLSSSRDDITGSPSSSTSGFNSISSMAESEGRARTAVVHELDASAKVQVYDQVYKR